MFNGLVVLACCFFLILLLPVVLFALTYIFRQACVLSGLPKPSVLAAAGHLFLITIAEFLADLIMVETVQWGCDLAGVPRWEVRIIIFFLFLPIDLVISSGIHAGLMGIRFGKGIEVWFVQRLIYLTIIAAAVFLGVLIYLIRAN